MRRATLIVGLVGFAPVLVMGQPADSAAANESSAGPVTQQAPTDAGAAPSTVEARSDEVEPNGYTPDRPLRDISALAWRKLTNPEREKINLRFSPVLYQPSGYGVVLSSMTANTSTDGSTAGSAVGGAVAHAAYADASIRRGNYSLLGGLLIGLIGAAIGSSANAAPSISYVHKYVIKLGTGEIVEHDQVTGAPLSRASGICVAYPIISAIQSHVCDGSAEAAYEYIIGKREATSAPPKPAALPCTPTNIAKLHASGLTDGQIGAICATLEVVK